MSKSQNISIFRNSTLTGVLITLTLKRMAGHLDSIAKLAIENKMSDKNIIID